mgnify:FL=1
MRRTIWILVVVIATHARGEDTATAPALASISANGLLQYGLGAGVAFVIDTPTVVQQYPTQSQWGFGAMPYVGLFPAFLWLRLRGALETVAYCSANTLDSDEAQRMADAYARQRAVRVAKRRGISEPYLVNDDFVETYTGWTPKVKGTCWATRFGIYAGLPTAYSANTVAVEGREVQAADLKPLFSVGLVYNLNAALSVVVGYERSQTKVSYPLPDGAEGTRDVWREVPTLLFGFGGSIDLIPALISVK